jgi:hypothetical protein
MGRIEVAYGKYPEHADALKQWAHDDSPPDAALLDKRQWDAIQAGKRPPAAQSRGLGDTVAKLTKAVGIKPCGKCEARRRKLNRWRPYQA